jgi:hypothetical protein
MSKLITLDGLSHFKDKMLEHTNNVYATKSDLDSASIPYAIVKNNTAEEGSASTYRMVRIDKDGNYVELENSATINIPKDMVVESGEVKECTEDNVPVEGYVVGNKYIDLVLANSDDQHLYINVSDLIDTHNVGKNVEGASCTYNSSTFNASTGAEIFNDYSGNKAANMYSHAEGQSTKSLGMASHAEGQGTTALGMVSHAEGQGTIASGSQSHAEGQGSTASGTCSHAEGNSTASNSYTHSEGLSTVASGQRSHAEGYGSKAEGENSHAEGQGTTAYGVSSHSEGVSTNIASTQITINSATTNDQIITAWTSKTFSLAKGKASHVEGEDNLALGSSSHAEGYHATASGYASHAEGYRTKATGENAHAEGELTTASGNNSHAEGYEATASGLHSHAEGYQTKATGETSHAGGSGTTAAGKDQYAIGKYNVIDDQNKYAFIIGNGTFRFDSSIMNMVTTPSNAFAVDWDGKLYINNSEEGVDVADLSTRVATLEAQGGSGTIDAATNEEIDAMFNEAS